MVALYSTRRKRQVKEPADDQEGSSDEEEAGWSEALEVANTKISKLQSDAKAKKSKLTAANQLVQTKATQLNEAQTRADEAEQKNTILTQQVQDLTRVVSELKTLVKGNISSGKEKRKPAAAEVVAEPEAGSMKSAVAGDRKQHYTRPNPMMFLEIEKRKRRRREQALFKQQMDLDDAHDDLFAAQWGCPM